VSIQRKFRDYSFFDCSSKQRTKKLKVLCLKKHNLFNILKKISFTIHKFESINCHQFIFPHKKSFLHVKTWSFSLLVWVGNFLQNVRDGRSLVPSNRLTNLAQRLLAHKLLLNYILLSFYILDQNFLRATSTFLMTERLVGSPPIGMSQTGLKVSGLPFLRVSFLKEPETCLKNCFCVFLDTQMSEYNLSSILEQVTTDSGFLKR
jgi:hypothetical protein